VLCKGQSLRGSLPTLIATCSAISIYLAAEMASSGLRVQALLVLRRCPAQLARRSRDRCSPTTQTRRESSRHPKKPCPEWVGVPAGTWLGRERCCPWWGFRAGCVMGRDNAARFCWRSSPGPCLNPTRTVTSSKPSRGAHGSSSSESDG